MPDSPLDSFTAPATTAGAPSAFGQQPVPGRRRMSLNDALAYHQEAGKADPSIAALPPAEFSRMVEEDYPEVDMSAYRDSNIFNRGVSEINTTAGQLGQGLEHMINPQGNSGIQSILGKAAADVVESGPAIALGIGQALMPEGAIAAWLGRGAMGLYAYDSAVNSGSSKLQGAASGVLQGLVVPAAAVLGGGLGRGLLPGVEPSLARTAAGVAGAGLAANIPSVADQFIQGNWQQMDGEDKIAFMLSQLPMGLRDIAHTYKGEVAASRAAKIAATPGLTQELPTTPANYLKSLGLNFVDSASPNTHKYIADLLHQAGPGADTISPELAMLQTVVNKTPEIESRIEELKAYQQSRNDFQAYQASNIPEPFMNAQGKVLSANAGTFPQAFEVARRLKQSLGLNGQLEEHFEVRPDGHILNLSEDDSIFPHLTENGFQWGEIPPLVKPVKLTRYSWEDSVANMGDWLFSDKHPGQVEWAKHIIEHEGKYGINTGRVEDAFVEQAKQLGFKPAEAKQGILFSQEGDDARVSGTFFVNNVLDRFNQALQPRVEGTKIKPSELQPDKEGMFNSAQLRAAISKNVGPDDLLEYYNAAGLKDLLAKPKVSGDEFRNFIKKATPEIEVKLDLPLKSHPDVIARNQHLHVLETAGYQLTTQDEVQKGNQYWVNQADIDEKPRIQTVQNSAIDTSYKPTDISTVPFEVRKYFELQAKTEALHGHGAKSFTYQVEPIPVSQMDRPVAILVREPTSSQKIIGKNNEKFIGSHHGTEDRNVLAFARGYFSSKDTFHVFEIQSDWFPDQKRKQENFNKENELRKKLDEVAPPGDVTKAFGRMSLSELKATDNPLLPHYIKLALRAAINHARENGATKLAVSTADTNMLVEGHDLNKQYKSGDYSISGLKTLAGRSPENGYSGNVSIDNHGEVKVQLNDGTWKHVYGQEYDIIKNQIPQFSPQEGRARKIYDLDSQKFLEKVTGDKGTVQALGKLDIPWRTPDYNENGKFTEAAAGKDNSAKVYDITNLKPGWNRLFSLYDVPKNYSLNKQISENSRTIREALSLPSYTLKTWPEFIKQISSPQFTADTISKLVSQIRNVQPGLLGIFESPSKIAGFYRDNEGVPHVNWTPDTAKLASTALHELTHQAQENFAQENPAEMAKYESLLGSQSKAWRLAWAKDVIEWSGAKHMSPEYISSQHLEPTDPNHNSIVAREMMASMTQAIMYKELQSPTARPFENIISKLPVGMQNILRYAIDSMARLFGSTYPSVLPQFSPEAGSRLTTVLESLRQTTLAAQQTNKTAYEMLGNLHRIEPENLAQSSMYGPLTQLSYTDPFLTQLPSEYRTVAKEILYSQEADENGKVNFRGFEKLPHFWNYASSMLGLTARYPYTRDLFNTLQRFRSGVTRTEQMYSALLGQDDGATLDPTIARKRYQSWLFDINGSSARQGTFGRAIDNDQKLRFENKPVLTREERKAQFGLNDRDNEMIDRVYQATEAVAYSKMKAMRSEHSLRIASMIASDGSVPVDVAREIGGRLQAVGDALAQDNSEQGQIAADLTIRQALAGIVKPTSPIPTKDPLISLIRTSLESFSKTRTALAASTSLGSYAPKVRMKQFIVDAYNLGKDGLPDYENRAPVRDFATATEAKAYVSQLAKAFKTVNVLDKEGLAGRYEFHVGTGTKAVFAQHSKNLLDIINQYKDTVPDTTPGYNNIIATFESMATQVKSGLAQDLSDAIAVKGNPWAERRMNVAGFEPLDYIPNLMEYLQISTVRDHKAVAHAESSLQMLRPEIQQNSQLGERLKKLRDYSLNATHNELAPFRKFIFNYMLGASMKYYWQNAFHLPLVGLPKFAEYSGSWLGSYKQFFDSGNLSRRYASTGDTGNEQLNSLLKQAQVDGVTLPHNLENWLKPTDFDRDIAADNLFSKGSEKLGAKVHEARVRASQKLQEFLSSTGVMSEIINRRVSYIMAANHELKSLGREATTEELGAIHKKVSNFVDDVNYVGDKANRPGFIQGLGQTPAHGPFLTLTALQSFNINYISQMAGYWENGKIGSWDATANARRGDGSATFPGRLGGLIARGNPSTKALSMAIAHMAVMAGAMGLPFMKDADDLTQKLFRVNLTRALRQKLKGLDSSGNHLEGSTLAAIDEATGGHLTDAALEGIPYAVGVDASQALGLGSVLNLGSEGMGSGVGGELVEKLKAAAESLRNGAYADGNGWANFVRQAAPNFLSYWLRLADSQYRGYYAGWHGEPSTMQPLTGPSVTSLGLGFRPTQVSREANLKAWSARDTDIQISNFDNSTQRSAMALNDAKHTGDSSHVAKAQQIQKDFLDQYSNVSPVAYTRATANEQLTLLQEALAENLRNAYSLGRNQAALGVPTINVKSRVGQFQQQVETAQQLNDPLTLLQAMTSTGRLRNAAAVDALVGQGMNPAQAQALTTRKTNSILTLEKALQEMGQPGGNYSLRQ